ncbi:MAG: class I SAM-dependent methyltransferase [Cytophagia bacterium]|nr:class I SAM-dependent methyltransferase [Cytophagia bacterium]
MKRFLKKWFPLIISLRNRVYNFLAHYRFKDKPVEEVFLTIFRENHWRDKESKSGTGSNEKNTIVVINIISRVINELEIKSMLDIPCGDFYWMQKVKLNNVMYTGGDIVQELVLRNQQNYSSEKRNFDKLNIISSSLPVVDLIFTRDCLVHFSYNDIMRTIANIKKSGSKYWMITTFPEHKNHDIITGDWRPLNLQSPPFNFPKPFMIYNEFSNEGDEYKDKSLAIWRINDL